MPKKKILTLAIGVAAAIASTASQVPPGGGLTKHRGVTQLAPSSNPPINPLNMEKEKEPIIRPISSSVELGLSPAFPPNRTNKQTSNPTDSLASEREFKRAVIKTSLTIASAGVFGAFLMLSRGVATGYEFFAGYLVEQSLSVDNLFVFIMLFEYFHVPPQLQNRVLSWGIAGAVALRGLMIGAGAAALQRFRSVILLFAGILIASSVKLLNEGEGGAEDEEDLGDNFVIKLTRMLFPNTSTEFHGEDFFVQDGGKKVATPLLLCLVCVELSDFVFAVDSIPAVLGVSKDPLVVYASNIFAIMALRSLYTVVAKAVTELRYLRPAVALVLGFVGIKMIAEYYHLHIGTGWSLVAVCAILGSGVLASLVERRNTRQVAETHAFVSSPPT